MIFFSIENSNKQTIKFWSSEMIDEYKITNLVTEGI